MNIGLPIDGMHHPVIARAEHGPRGGVARVVDPSRARTSTGRGER